jgi:hypothetical protein
MAKSTGKLGAGVVVGYSTATSGNLTYTKLAQLLDCAAPKQQRDDVDISNHDSASVRKETIPGWLGAGDATANWLFDKADLVTLDGFVKSGQVLSFQYLYPDTSSHNFTAYVKDLGLESPRNDKMTQDVTLHSDDSDIVFTPAA